MQKLLGTTELNSMLKSLSVSSNRHEAFNVHFLQSNLDFFPHKRRLMILIVTSTNGLRHLVVTVAIIREAFVKLCICLQC